MSEDAQAMQRVKIAQKFDTCPLCSGHLKCDRAFGPLECETCGSTFPAQALADAVKHRLSTARGGMDYEYTKRQIAELVEEGDGFWRPCSGCQESSDGCVSAKDYPWSDIFQCQPGSGCRECGGIGVTWDDTDYEEFARWSLLNKEGDHA